MKKLIVIPLFILICFVQFAHANIGSNLTHLAIYSRDSLVVDTNVVVLGQWLSHGGVSGTVTQYTDSVYAIDDSLSFVELNTLHSNLSALTFTSIPIVNNSVLTPGNYEVAPGNFPNNVSLTGDSNSVYVFHVAT